MVCQRPLSNNSPWYSLVSQVFGCLGADTKGETRRPIRPTQPWLESVKGQAYWPGRYSVASLVRSQSTNESHGSKQLADRVASISPTGIRQRYTSKRALLSVSPHWAKERLRPLYSRRRVDCSVTIIHWLHEPDIKDRRYLAADNDGWVLSLSSYDGSRPSPNDVPLSDDTATSKSWTQWTDHHSRNRTWERSSARKDDDDDVYIYINTV